MRRRISSDAGILLTILVVFAVASFLMVRETTADSHELRPHRTTNSPRPGGVRALYLTLRELGYPVRQQRAPLTKLPPRGVLFMLDPAHSSPTTVEWKALMRWVGAGNAVLLAADGRGQGLGLPLTNGGSGPGDLFFPEDSKAAPMQFDALTRGVTAFHVKSGARLSGSVWAPPGNPEAAALRKVRRARRGAKSPTPAMPAASSEDTIEPERPINPLLADAPSTGKPQVLSGTVAASGVWGKGLVVLLASPSSLANDGIGRADNFRFVMNLLRRFNCDRQFPVLFDEYHQGFGVQRTLASLFSPPMRMAALQLAVAGLLLLFLRSRRFGRPTALPGEGQRTRDEYLTAMALFFKRGRALEAARQALGAEFVRQVTGLLALPANATTDEIAITAEARRGVDPLRMRTALAGTGPGTRDAFKKESDLLRFAQELHALKLACGQR